MRVNESQQLCSCVVIGMIVLATPLGAQPRPFAHFDVEFSSDAVFLGTSGDQVRVYEVKTGKRLREIDTGGYARSIAFSPVTAELFAAGGDDGFLRLWSTGKKDFIREFEGHAGMVTSVAFDKSGKYMASTSVRYADSKSDLGQFRLWDIETGKEVQSLDIKESNIQGVSFSSDGKLVAFWRKLNDETGHVDVYSVQPWKRVTSIKLDADEKLKTTAHGKAVPFGLATRFEPDSKRLLVAGGICVRVDPRPYTYACLPTGLLWRADLTEPSSAKLLDEPKRGYYRSLGVAPDGKQFATGNGSKGPFESALIQMRDVSNGKLLWSVASDVEPYGVAMSLDGELVAACQRDGIHLLNAKSGESIRVIVARP